jgi:hypothetical protein
MRFMDDRFLNLVSGLRAMAEDLDKSAREFDFDQMDAATACETAMREVSRGLLQALRRLEINPQRNSIRNKEAIDGIVR